MTKRLRCLGKHAKTLLPCSNHNPCQNLRQCGPLRLVPRSSLPDTNFYQQAQNYVYCHRHHGSKLTAACRAVFTAFLVRDAASANLRPTMNPPQNIHIQPTSWAFGPSPQSVHSDAVSNNTYLMPSSPSRRPRGPSDSYKPTIIKTCGQRPACLVNASVTYCGNNSIYAFGGFDQFTDEGGSARPCVAFANRFSL